MSKIFTNPKNNKKGTAAHWSNEYEYKNANNFRVFANKCLLEGRPEDAYCSKEERNKRGIEKSTIAPLYTNPTPDENGKYISKTAVEWAKHLKMSKSGWSCRVRKWGKDDPRVYMTASEINELKKEAISAASKARAERQQTGPKMPHENRRGNLQKTKIGTWEAENIPDRWGHLKGCA